MSLITFVSCFEFKTSSGNIYWLPVNLNTNDKAQAERMMNAISVAIQEQQHIVISQSGPEVLNSGTYRNNAIQATISAMMTGEKQPIIINVWERTIGSVKPAVGFREYSNKLFETPEVYAGTTVAHTVQRLRLPVRQIQKSKSGPDFLILDIMSP